MVFQIGLKDRPHEISQTPGKRERLYPGHLSCIPAVVVPLGWEFCNEGLEITHDLEDPDVRATTCC